MDATLRTCFGLLVVATVCALTGSTCGAQLDSYESYVVERLEDNGILIDIVTVPGRPPPVHREPAATPPPADSASSLLPNVPAFTWCYGCSATSAAMMMGYYDQYAYPDNMYAGPANGGVCPMNNETAWPDPLGGSSGYCPLSATKDGLDGRLIKGHVDDYWVAYGQFGNDPYAGNWTEHTYGDCTGDYMGTNQDKWNNPDGSTAFAFMPKDNPDYAGYPLYDYTGGEASGWRDGGHGMRLFAESRGYTFPLVSPPKPVEPGLKADVFNQHILGYAHATRGFTFADYKAEIDNLRPVLIHVVGHTMLGFGYDDTGNTVYLCDTWDNNYHTMTWGGSYSGHVHTGVTCFNITDPTPVILSDLRAETGHGRIRVIWETATEFGAAGYVVLRSERLRGPFERINHGIIAATGQPGEIAKYEFVDESVQPGRTYFYRIAEVAPDGAIEELPDLTKAVAGGAMLYNLLPPQLRALLPL